MNKLDLLEKYYSENPFWEQRRFEVMKDLAVKSYKEFNVIGPFYKFGLGSGDFKLDADKVLALINPEIKKLVTENKFKVTMKHLPKEYETWWKEPVVYGYTYNDSLTLTEIIKLFHKKWKDFSEESASNYTLQDFKIVREN